MKNKQEASNYYKIAQENRVKGNFESYLEYLDKAVRCEAVAKEYMIKMLKELIFQCEHSTYDEWITKTLEHLDMLCEYDPFDGNMEKAYYYSQYKPSDEDKLKCYLEAQKHTYGQSEDKIANLVHQTAVAYACLDNYEKSMEYYEKYFASVDDPQYICYAQDLIQFGKYDKAIEVLSSMEARAAQGCIDMALTYSGLSLCYKEKGQLEISISYANKLITFTQYGYFDLAACHMKQGDKDKAWDAINKSFEKNEKISDETSIYFSEVSELSISFSIYVFCKEFDEQDGAKEAKTHLKELGCNDLETYSVNDLHYIFLWLKENGAQVIEHDV